MLFKRGRDLPSTMVDSPYKRSLKVLFGPEDDPAVNFTLLESILHPRGGSTAFHQHPHHGELMYVASGYGKLTLGDSQYDIEGDAVFFAPPGTSHRVVNHSHETMKILCFFSPQLPREYMEEMQKQFREGSGKD